MITRKTNKRGYRKRRCNTDSQTMVNVSPKTALHKPEKYQIQVEQELEGFRKDISKKNNGN